MNQFLNNNSDEIIKEMKPAANAAIAKYFKGFLNSAFVKLPLKLWLPDAQATIHNSSLDFKHVSSVISSFVSAFPFYVIFDTKPLATNARANIGTLEKCV